MHNWENISCLLNQINKTQYLILRNYEDFPENVITNKNEDIDILCENKEEFIKCIHAYPVSSDNSGHNFYVLVDNNRIYIDVRYIGDKYYDCQWEKNMLDNRHLYKNSFYIMNDMDYRYSLLYHAILHKKRISPKYNAVLHHLFCQDLNNTKTPDAKQLKTILSKFMLSQNYKCTKPIDSGVYFNMHACIHIMFKMHCLYWQTILSPT